MSEKIMDQGLLQDQWLSASVKPLQIIVAGVLIFLTCLVTGGAWLLGQRHIDREVLAVLQGFDQLFQGELNQEAVLLDSILDRYQGNSDFQHAFLARDRKLLLAFAGPEFAKINAEYQVTNFYFHNPDKTCFLRIHNPSHHSDAVRRFTLAEAVRTGQTAVGIELGQMGTFILRVIQPWRIDGKIAGYLELGKDINHLTPHLRSVLNAELIFIIDKSFLDRNRWEKGMKMSGKHGDWELLPRQVIIDSSLEHIPAGVNAYLTTQVAKHRRKLFTVMVAEQRFRGGAYPLVDAGGRDVGCVIVMKNITRDSKALLLGAQSLAALTLLLIFIAYRIFYTYMKKLKQEIRINTLAKDITHAILKLSFTSLSLQELLQRSLEWIVKADFALEMKGSIFLAEKKSQSLTMQAHYGLTEELLRSCARIPFGRCLCGKVAETGKTVFADSVIDDHHIRYKGMLKHGHYCLPIKSAERLLGVLNVYVPAGHRQKPFEIDLLQMVTNTLAAIIERKLIEENLQLFRSLLDAAHDTVLVIDPKTGMLLDANEASCRNLGYTHAELLEMKIADIETLLPNEAAWKARLSELRERKNIVLDGLHLRKDGSKYPVEVNIRLTFFEGREFIVAVARDISERELVKQERREYAAHLEEVVEKRTRELKQAERELARQEKLAAIGKLAATVRHDLRNPLGVISNAVYFLKMKLTGADDKVLYHLDLLQKQVDRSDAIISELLDFSKEIPLTRQTTSVNKLLTATLKVIAIPDRINVETRLAEDLPEIDIDPPHMQRVFQNLIINAIQAMPDKGRLVIATDSKDDFVEVVIRDNGCGIGTDELTMIFDPLFTTKPDGIGLGLSIVSDIVKQHGGEVYVESEIGKGAVFTVRLKTK